MPSAGLVETMDICPEEGLESTAKSLSPSGMEQANIDEILDPSVTEDVTNPLNSARVRTGISATGRAPKLVVTAALVIVPPRSRQPPSAGPA